MVGIDGGGGQLFVAPGNGLGALAAPIFSGVCGGTCFSNNTFTLGDLNNDGNLDALVSHPAFIAPSSTTIHLGTGTGTFTPFGGNPNPLPYSPLRMMLADVNRDGNLDLLEQIGAAQFLQVWPGAGNGGFGPPSPYSMVAPAGMRPALSWLTCTRLPAACAPAPAMTTLPCAMP